jgi:hypothetical protein
LRRNGQRNRGRKYQYRTNNKLHDVNLLSARLKGTKAAL